MLLRVALLEMMNHREGGFERDINTSPTRHVFHRKVVRKIHKATQND